MRTTTCYWTPADGWSGLPPTAQPTHRGEADCLVLAFCDPSIGADPAPMAALSAVRPGAVVVGCSTAGQISGPTVSDVEVIATVIDFESTVVAARIVHIPQVEASGQAGEQLAQALLAARDGAPAAVIVLSDGLLVNGTGLVAGINSVLPVGVPVSGGLAGDGPRFEHTWVYLDGAVHTQAAVAVGLWGSQLQVSHGSAGGWQGFGPIRAITKSVGSVLFELDGQPALSLYKAYLGDQAADLPGSALLFPLRITSPDGQHDLVRTVLAVDEASSSMQFAGDIPMGWRAQLMRTTVDRLVDGASNAATLSKRDGTDPASAGDSLAVAVSCVGRRLVMGGRTEEETEACLETLGAGVQLVGFYSYGEISPIDGYASLHNQTMTLTVLSERLALPEQLA